MGAIAILTPIVIATWPAFTAAVATAATTLGYHIIQSAQDATQTVSGPRSVQLEIPHSEVVTDQLGRDQHITLSREGVTVRFQRDERGRASVYVTGEGREQSELEAIGRELSGCVIQRYVHQKVLDEAKARGFLVVEEAVDENQAIRMKVRLWDS